MSDWSSDVCSSDLVADPSVCTVIAGGCEYARAVLPLFEFGRTINVALPRRK